MIIDPNVKRCFTGLKIGDWVQICTGFATVMYGGAQVRRIGKKYFEVLASGASGTWSFRREDGKAAPGYNPQAFVITPEEARHLKRAYELGLRQQLRLNKKVMQLCIGEGEI